MEQSPLPGIEAVDPPCIVASGFQSSKVVFDKKGLGTRKCPAREVSELTSGTNLEAAAQHNQSQPKRTRKQSEGGRLGDRRGAGD